MEMLLFISIEMPLCCASKCTLLPVDEEAEDFCAVFVVSQKAPRHVHSHHQLNR